MATRAAWGRRPGRLALTAMTRNNRFSMQSARHAHTKAPYKPNLLWEVLRPLDAPGGPGPLLEDAVRLDVVQLRRLHHRGRRLCEP